MTNMNTITLLAASLPVALTGADITNGIPGEGCNCPVALALKRVCPGAEVVVGIQMAYVRFGGRGGVIVEAKLPITAFHWVWDFDRGRKVQPISFELTFTESTGREAELALAPI